MLEVKPITLRAANSIIKKWHRHHKEARGCRFCLAAYSDGLLCGVVITGRPVSRMEDPQEVLEITRCATDGTFNAISKLYGAVCRAAKAMGYKTVQTFTLPEEGGASMRASGFTLKGECGGGSWSRKGRKRREDQPQQKKIKWSKKLT